MGVLHQKVQEKRLRWYGHLCKEDTHVTRRVLEMEVEPVVGKGRQGRPEKVDGLCEKGHGGENND